MFKRFIITLCFLPAIAMAAIGGKFSFVDEKESELLSDQQAFKTLEAKVQNGVVTLVWQSAADYYLYKKNFKILSASDSVDIGEINFPQGVIEEDPLFGDVEVYFYDVELTAPVTFKGNTPSSVELILHAQGCNKPVGICYPPQIRNVVAPVTELGAETTSTKRVASQQDAKSIWAYLITAFGAGLLLVFTPCVLPLLPILSGIIVGQNKIENHQSSSRVRAGILSALYVLGTAITYTAMGILAGAAGIQLQAYFQHPAFIAGMAVLIFLMALAMFGVFSISTSSKLQTKVDGLLAKFSMGSYVFAFIMGLVSALIVSACVSPLLISFLAVAIQQGNPILGGLMMLSMSLGMGVLLIAFGMGADWLIPKSGIWMEKVKEFFGLTLLAVAIVVLSAIKSIPILFAWSAWLLICGLWLWNLNSVQGESKHAFGKLIVKAASIFILLWGAAAFVGGMTGAQNVLKPLSQLSVYSDSIGTGLGGTTGVKKLNFDVVTTEAEIKKYLALAKAESKPVLVDYYADWCTDCVRMEQSTYLYREVQDALKNWKLLKIDVTKTNGKTLKAKQYFNVFGPPATLFVNSDGIEEKAERRYGYISADELIDIITTVNKENR